MPAKRSKRSQSMWFFSWINPIVKIFMGKLLTYIREPGFVVRILIFISNLLIACIINQVEGKIFQFNE